MVGFIDSAKKFYEDIIKDLLHTKYNEYEDRIAVGLVGEGSECFGYDDEISKDHDYEVSLCIWLCDNDYEKIGKELADDYKKAVEEYCVKNKIVVRYLYNSMLSCRRGVVRISDFYSNILSIKVEENRSSFSDAEYFYTDDKLFATCVNGEVFVDSLGLFSNIRNIIKKHYPEKIYKYKLKNELHLFSQYGQSNYERSMSRKDYVTAKICISNCIESCMKILCLIEKEYAPYYKWIRKKVQSFDKYEEIDDLIEKILLLPLQDKSWENYKYDARLINENDEVEVMIDELGHKIAHILYINGLIKEEDKCQSFLEGLVNKIL